MGNQLGYSATNSQGNVKKFYSASRVVTLRHKKVPLYSRTSPYFAQGYCKTIFFRHILILLFLYVENLLRFNLADFPVNFSVVTV